MVFVSSAVLETDCDFSVEMVRVCLEMVEVALWSEETLTVCDVSFVRERVLDFVSWRVDEIDLDLSVEMVCVRLEIETVFVWSAVPETV